MQATETLSEGLKREFRVVIPVAELASKADTRLAELKDRVRLNGFRPGKVPVEHLKRLYGRSAMLEAIEAAVRETNAQLFTERGYKIASEPKINMPSEDTQVEALVNGKMDLDYTLAFEIIPKIELADFKSIKLKRLVAEVTDQEIDEGLAKIAEQNRPFAAKAEGAKAEKGDRVVVSFSGTIDGKPFEGGTGSDIAVLLGSNTFIPGFEDQLLGIGTGETRTVNASFPPNYMNAELAGKAAAFEVTANSIEAPGEVKIDDEFAKSLGLESLAKLRDALKDRLTREHTAQSRQKLKRQLFDALDERHKYEAPPSLVEEEFDRMWKSITGELQSEGKTFADENTTEEKAREEYRAIAERRVRLGLVLAEIGEKNNISVTEEELRRAVAEKVRQFPGQEQQVWDYYRKNAGAVAALRAPIYEEKVVDFVLELAQVSDEKVSREDLYKEDETAAA